MKALVTGATGFIGSHLAAELLRNGYAVRGLLLPHEDDRELVKLGMEIYRGDLTVADSLEKIADDINIVFHLAARTLDWGTYRQFSSIVVDGTQNLLEASKGKIDRFVYFSSIAALGFHRGSVGLDEGAKRKNCGIPYCDTKIIAEDLVREFCTAHALGFTIIRPANVFGPGSVWVREILDAFKRWPFPLINGGSAPGAFIYIDNLVDGTILAAESSVADGKIYHFRDDYSITWSEYLRTIGGWIGKKPVVNLPFKPVWILGGILERILTPLGIRPPLTRLTAGVMGLNNEVDTKAARSELSWKSRVSLEEALEKTRAWVYNDYLQDVPMQP